MDIDENAGQETPPAQQPNGGGGNDGGGGGGGGGGNGGPADVEQFLLHQFSRMGTTDHDELVNQLQKVLGNQLNYNTARFFLDMNNWNLQAAVGFYLDYYSGMKLPSMQIISDVTIGEGEAITPNTPFVQSWSVRNNGEEAWPYGCYIKSTSNENLPMVPVEPIEPGQCTVISVNLRSPCELGSFQTKWRLFTSNGSCFGDTMWSIVQVTESGTLALTQQLSELRTNNTADIPMPKPTLEGPQSQIDDCDM